MYERETRRNSSKDREGATGIEGCQSYGWHLESQLKEAREEDGGPYTEFCQSGVGQWGLGGAF